MRLPVSIAISYLTLAVSTHAQTCTAPCSYMTLELYPETAGCSDVDNLLASSDVPTTGDCVPLNPQGQTVRTLGVTVRYQCYTETYAVSVYVDSMCETTQVVNVTDYTPGTCDSVYLTALGPLAIQGVADASTCTPGTVAVEQQVANTNRIDEESFKDDQESADDGSGDNGTRVADATSSPTLTPSSSPAPPGVNCAFMDIQVWFAIKDEAYVGECSEDGIVDRYTFPVDGKCTLVTKDGEIPLVWISGTVSTDDEANVGLYSDDACVQRVGLFEDMDVSSNAGRCYTDENEQVSVKPGECTD
ncbi:hypothetical protein SARC_13344 [Sphaeroforma arctica JP610]|uniref:SUEL-type lectin domain-containing protein n=1 Tax=Sphaeroforma arctica JP610 TaxID=667725 RepID=A0A0L0FBK1_9EUKA|nr:hypothetical protein SARC_13344 [Sphaeroforma arctica JP610]KNC74099.1 hypothetical protein SARC_13344 [Sphaeroforma arctica JP610]|eukprot:XP_014148001.1 hypothetical protein SARC_13344 [Sphaeroforma arctica JP610]